MRRGDTAQGGVLQRQEELQELKAALDNGEAQVEELGEQLETRREQLRQWEAERDAVQREIQAHGRRQSELRAQLSAQQAKIEQMGERRQRLNSDIQELRNQFTLEQESLAEAEWCCRKPSRAWSRIPAAANSC